MSTPATPLTLEHLTHLQAQLDAQKVLLEEAQRKSEAEEAARAKAEAKAARKSKAEVKKAVGKGKGKAREVIDNDKVVIVETLTKKGKKGQWRMKGPDTSEPRYSGRKKACDLCTQRKLKCEGAPLLPAMKKPCVARQPLGMQASNTGKERVEARTGVPVASGLGSGGVAQVVAGVAPAGKGPSAGPSSGVPGRQDSLSAVMDSIERLWTRNAYFTNSELLFQLLGKVQGLRRELDEVWDELRADCELRKVAFVEYFASWVDDLADVAAEGNVRVQNDAEVEFTEGSGSEYEEESERLEEEED
ncbi:hypothetical protein BC628DRAFT_1337261 [Trametes gibbosa]|nr:hypothetical protein BC628DRAFT_1337261 [Trametes gibbosa]